jgi:mannose-6-phosphate isomerase class I
MAYKILPVFSEKLWGGSKLKELFNYDIPSDKTGEAWIISGYQGNQSIVDGTELGLNDFYKQNKELFNNYETEDFPLLVKILDAKDNLSIQVHPNNEQAMKLEGVPFGKSECWVVLDAAEGGTIIIDHKAKDKENLEEIFKNSDWDSFLNPIPVKRGDIFNIDSGLVHAIQKDTVIYELQQSSDTTYRIYDYDRLENGAPRELHLDKSKEVISFNNNNVIQNRENVLKTESVVIDKIVNNEYFDLLEWNVDGKDTISLGKEYNFLLVTNIEGEITINGIKLIKGDNLIVTSDELDNINIEGKAKLFVGNPK